MYVFTYFAGLWGGLTDWPQDCCVVENDLEILILQLPTSQVLDYRCARAHPTPVQQVFIEFF